MKVGKKHETRLMVRVLNVNSYFNVSYIYAENLIFDMHIYIISVGRKQPCPNPTYNLSFIGDLVGEHTEMRVDSRGLHIDDSGMYFVFMTQCLRTEDRCITNPVPNFKLQIQLKSTDRVLIQSDVTRAAGSLVFQPNAYCLFTRLQQRDSLGMNISEHKYLNTMLGSNVFVAFKLHDPKKRG